MLPGNGVEIGFCEAEIANGSAEGRAAKDSDCGARRVDGRGSAWLPLSGEDQQSNKQQSTNAMIGFVCTV